MARQKYGKKNFVMQKKKKDIWDVNIDNLVVISKLAETNSKYLTGYLDKVIRP